MPQLDLMHFFTQFFWFSIGFTFLYAYLLHNVVPTIAKNLKFRQKKLELLAKDINKGKDGVSNLLGIYDNLILLIYHLCTYKHIYILCQTIIWVSASSYQTRTDVKHIKHWPRNGSDSDPVPMASTNF